MAKFTILTLIHYLLDGFQPPVAIKPRHLLNKRQVKLLFKTDLDGELWKFYPCFEGMTGEEMCALSYDDFLRRCETAGEAFYFYWNQIIPYSDEDTIHSKKPTTTTKAAHK